MPSIDALIANVITLSPDQTVEEAMGVLEKNNIRAAPVLDKDERLVGMFSFKQVLLNLLPVSVTMDDGLQRLDFVIGAAPGVGKRLRKLLPQKVDSVMDRGSIVMQPDTPLWEVLRLLVKYGSPLPVVDDGTGKFIGLVTEQSALADLELTPEEFKAGQKKKQGKDPGGKKG